MYAISIIIQLCLAFSQYGCSNIFQQKIRSNQCSRAPCVVFQPHMLCLQDFVQKWEETYLRKWNHTGLLKLFLLKTLYTNTSSFLPNIGNCVCVLIFRAPKHMRIILEQQAILQFSTMTLNLGLTLEFTKQSCYFFSNNLKFQFDSSIVQAL